MSSIKLLWSKIKNYIASEPKNIWEWYVQLWVIIAVFYGPIFLVIALVLIFFTKD